MGKIIYIDPLYIEYRRMWAIDRWKFSAIMVNLTIKSNREKLSEEEQQKLDTLNRIVNEHGGNWLEETTKHKRKRR